MPLFDPVPDLAGVLPTRRTWLRFGVPAAVASMVAHRTKATQAKSRAKSVLVIFTSGGQSQLDTWDPKPKAPLEVRGEFDTIATRVPGTRICEHLPKLAARADRFTILRSMTHDDVDHGSACYLALTGRFHPQKSSNPPPQPSDDPALGAVLHRVRPTNRLPHSAFQINGPLLVPTEPAPGQNGGFLGHGYDPIELGEVENESALLMGIRGVSGISSARRESRKRLAAMLDAASGSQAYSDSHQTLMQQAYNLIDSPIVGNAFHLETESAKVRDRYGRYRAGQACLLGRRLVEAGVPWVKVFFNHTIRGQDQFPNTTDAYGWDTHNDIFDAMRHQLLPRFDHTLSVLLDDLEMRGLLKETLVVCMGEFGRAPTVKLEKNFAGSSPGRKHWARCYSVVLAGAGVKRGFVYGSSDRFGAYPQENPTSPGDLAATMFQALGIDPETHYADRGGRPMRIITGKPIDGLWE